MSDQRDKRIDELVALAKAPRQVINRTGEDIFELLWVAAAFAPLTVFYTALLLALDAFFKSLSAIVILKDVVNLLGFGTSTLIILIVQTAAKKSHNDYIAGPIEQLNLYTFFFLGLVKGGILLAAIFVVVYFVAETVGIPFILKENISKNAEIQARLLGFSRRAFIPYHYFFHPFVTVFAALSSYLLLVYFFPVDQWISNGIIFQIRFMTLQVVLWTIIYKVIMIRIEKIGVRRDFLISRFLGLLIPPMFLPNQTWAWILYLIGIVWAWLDIGRHIWLGARR